MAETFEFGEAVAYCPGYTHSVGRYVGPANGLNSFVCFSTGCTAAKCPTEFLRKATEQEAAIAAGIGHHRFDEFCPDWDAGVCGHCKAKPVGHYDAHGNFLRDVK